MKNLKILSFLLAVLCIGLTSCGDDLAQDTLLSTENFVGDAFVDLQQSRGDRNPCVELVFPITISFSDNTTATVADQEELKTNVQTWKDNNTEVADTTGGKRGHRKGYRPDLVFPIQVINQDGETLDIASQDELKAAKATCGDENGRKRGNGGKGKRGDKGEKCFSLVYPLTYNFADGTAQTFEDAESKREALKTYKEENGRDAERPSLGFPVTAEYEDGTQITADSVEALQELKDTCTNEG